MKILMTGSHGFVGTNLIEALLGEHEIIRWNIRSNEDLPECDAVIHLAGKAHDVRNVTNEDEYFMVNTELTKKIFHAYLQSHAKKFIFFSSIKAQDNDTPYAKSKRLAEEYILNTNSQDLRNERASSSGMNSTNKRIYILRLCMIHGKGVKGNLPLLFNIVKRGLPWPLAAFENQRSYAFIGNVNFVINELLNQDIESGTYNLCDDEPVSTNDLIRLMNKCIGNKPNMIKIPKVIVQFGVKIGDILHLPLNTERFGKLAGDYIVDNSEIKWALGIKQMPIKAMDGLRFTIQELIKKD